MPDDDPVETETPVFTEEDVFMIAGYLADTWDVGDTGVVAATEEAIAAVLSREYA